MKHSYKCRKCGLVQYVSVPLTPLFPERLPTVEELENLLIEEAIRRTGSRKEAAALIGIGKTTMYRKLPLADSASIK